MDTLEAIVQANHASPDTSARGESPPSQGGVAVIERSSPVSIGPATTQDHPELPAAELAARAVTAPKANALAAFSADEVAAIRLRLSARLSPEPNTGCLLWTGAATAEGYGKIGVGIREKGTRRILYVHRLAYELERGPIPDGMTLDHLCRVRCCANALHLEPVSTQVNTSRRAKPAPGEMSARVLRSWATRRAAEQAAFARVEAAAKNAGFEVLP
jgi:hypothetical protein